MSGQTEQNSLKSKTAKGLLWGGLSNGFQQLLNLVFGIFLARLLTPADYGLVGLLTIFSLIATSIQESGFISALANQKTVEHKDYNAVFWTSIFISVIGYSILFFCAPLIASFYNMPELVKLSRYLFLSFVVGSFGIAHNAYLFRNLLVSEKAISVTISVFVSGLLGVILAYLGYSYWGIASQTILYNLVFVCCVTFFSKFRPTFQIDFSPIRYLWRFSSKVLVTNIFNHINNNILTIFLGKYFHKADVGYFTQSNKWSNMGQSVIANMSHGFAQPLLASLNEDTDRQVRVFKKLFHFICFCSFPALFILLIIAPEFITLTITEKWAGSVPLLQILCLSAAFMPLTNYYSNFFLGRGKSSIYMWNIILFGLSQLILILISYRFGIQTMVWSITLLTIIWSFIWQWLVCRELKISFFNLTASLFGYLLFAVIASAVGSQVDHITSNLYVVIMLKILVTFMIYTISLSLFKNRILSDMIVLVKNRINKGSV